MNEFDYGIISNPEIFEINRRMPHSDNHYVSGRCVKTDLNGTYKFHFDKCIDDAVKDFYKPDYDVSGWDDIKVPGNVPVLRPELDAPIYTNVMYPWDGHEDIVPVKYNPVYSYVRDIEINEITENKTFIRFEGVESAFALWINGYFTGYITQVGQPIIWMLIYVLITATVVYKGVNKGIEKYSKILMPILFVLIAGISVFSLTLKHTNADGVTRTGMQGLAIYLIPNFRGMTVKSFLSVVMDALGQLFFSISVAMGIMVTYGSYAKKETNLMKSINQIEFFDTLVALLAGLMIIPAVFAFSGGNPDNLQAGPSLMFITLPKVFASMGFGTATGIVFFILVLLAALTSAVSLMETSVSTFMDELHWSRKKCCGLMVVIMIVLGTASSMGYGLLDFIRIFGMNFLDFFDFMTNSVMMPLAALATCILILRVVGIDGMVKEIEQSSPFRRKKLYRVFIKYFAPICLIIILLSSIANVLGIISM